MRKWISIIIIVSHSFAFAAEELEADTESSTGAIVRAVTIGSTYGILAGAFLGIASIGFSPKPSDELRNIAMGASIGLYAGILFGGYLAWATLSGEPGESIPSEEDYDNMDYESKLDPVQFNRITQNDRKNEVKEVKLNVPVFSFQF